MTKTVDDLLLLIAIGVGATVIGLKSLDTEEARLRAVIEHDCPEHLDELIIALNTGMRIRIDWSSVDLTRKDLAIPLTKMAKGDTFH